ncbi:MAG: hypothetical protein ABSA93_29035 [Streptosporangiaceae bacterium]|jgi:hypothetical protein
MDTSGLLDEALKKCSATKFSGVLRVAGDPGGTIYLAGGGIAACETPGAPGLEAILLRSRVISEKDWDEAFAASAMAGRPMTAELVARELTGAGELEALLRITLADCVFALVNGTIDGCGTEEGPVDCLLPLDPPSKPGWLLAESTRRAQVLAAFPEPAISTGDRIAAAPRAARKGADDILALADGRRTARDLAFALGRGLFATLLLLTRMRADDLVVVTSSRGEPSASRERAPGLPQRSKPAPRGDTSAMLRPRTPGSTKAR